MLKSQLNHLEKSESTIGEPKASSEVSEAGRGGSSMAVLRKVRRRLHGRGARVALVIAIAIECVIFGVGNSNFFTVSDFRLVLLQVSIDAIVAVTTTAVMIAGEIDLSFGAVIYLSGCVTAVVMTNLHQPIWIGICAGIASGILVGGVNGFASSVLRIPTFIATLAMLFISEGVALEITGGNAIPILSPSFGKLGGGYIGPIPLPVIFMIGAALLGWVWLTKTVSGAHVFETGSNRTGARSFGVRVNRVRFGVLVLQGAAAAVAGILLASRLASATPSEGSTQLLQVIAAVVIGGTSLFGGRGSVVGTMLGVLFIGIMANGMVLINVSPNYQQVIMGSFILGAVWIQNMRRIEA